VLNGKNNFFELICSKNLEKSELFFGAKIFVLGRTVPELAKKNETALIFGLFEQFSKQHNFF